LHDQVALDIDRECQGIILNESDGWRPVMYPCGRISNYLDSQAPILDWKTARIYDYLDGTLVMLYFYKNQWHVASLFEPSEPHVPINWKDEKDSSTLSQLFWEVWKNSNYNLPQDTKL